MNEIRTIAETPPLTLPASGIRTFAQEDARAVAELFHRIFMRKKRISYDALADSLNDIFLTSRYGATGNGSLVFAEPDGQITGFVGVVPTMFHAGDRTIRVAMVGSLMVEEPHKNPLKGARLVRAVSTGAYDMVLSETANAISRRMWDKVGSRHIPGYSLDFFKILHPARFALDIARRRYTFAALARPLAHALDALTARMHAKPIILDTNYAETDADAEEAAELILRLTQARTLRPAFDVATLTRRIQHGSVKRGYGDYVARIVRHRNGVPVGIYIYHAYAGRFAYVQHLLAEPKHMNETTARLITDAKARGAVALKGRSEPHNLSALANQRCFFTQRASMIVHTRDWSQVTPLIMGEGFATGLAGETWMQLIGDSFTD